MIYISHICDGKPLSPDEPFPDSEPAIDKHSVQCCPSQIHSQSQDKAAVHDCTCVSVVVHPQSPPAQGSYKSSLRGFAVPWAIREICDQMQNVKRQRPAPDLLPYYSQDETKKNLGATAAAALSSTGSSYYSRVKIESPHLQKNPFSSLLFFPSCVTITQRGGGGKKKRAILYPNLSKFGVDLSFLVS